MKTVFNVISVILALGLLVGCAQTTPAPTSSATQPAATSGADFATLIPMAQAFVDQMAKGDFTAAVSTFDSTMKSAMPEATLKSTWQQLVTQAGAFQQQVSTRTGQAQGYKIVYVTCRFENAAIDVKVVFDAQKQISGLFFNPGEIASTAFNDLIPIAQSWIDQMAKGDYAAAAANHLDDTMKNAFPASKIQQTWEQIVAQYGVFQKQTGTRTAEQPPYRFVYVTCEFATASIDFKVVFDNQGLIAGMNLAAVNGATPTQVPYSAPAYVDTTSFHEVQVTVGSGEWALPGTLTLPNGSGPFPAVVLVPGSGPEDRDETIGPNKPFRDLAWGLASQGVAVLRYDKRTKVHASKFTPDLTAKLTVQQEFIDDALLAANLLRQTQGIDRQRIFVLGHSEGGTVAPRIGQQDPSIAGLIILAGLVRPMEDAILEQQTYLFNLNGQMTAQQAGVLEVLKMMVAKVKDPKLSVNTPDNELPLGIPAAYWLDLRGYQPAELAKSLSMPMLIMQGGRDYQVTVKDYDLWKASLDGKTDVSFKWYPDLNHLFIAGSGPANPQEYMTEGHVSQEVVNDIDHWIKGH